VVETGCRGLEGIGKLKKLSQIKIMKKVSNGGLWPFNQEWLDIGVILN